MRSLIPCYFHHCCNSTIDLNRNLLYSNQSFHETIVNCSKKTNCVFSDSMHQHEVVLAVVALAEVVLAEVALAEVAHLQMKTLFTMTNTMHYIIYAQCLYIKICKSKTTV